MKKNAYSSIKSLKRLEEIKDKILEDLYGTFILEAGETMESRENKLKEELKAVNDRINKLKREHKKLEELYKLLDYMMKNECPRKVAEVRKLIEEATNKKAR